MARYFPQEKGIRALQLSGFHSCERNRAFAQWKKHSRTVIRIASWAGEPLAEKRASVAGSTLSSAVPLTRSVSSVPGTITIKPTCGFARMFCRPKSSLLPLLSGISRVLGFSATTKPGAPPLGETS